MEEFENILNEIIVFFDEIIDVENEKFNATLNNKVIIVEDCIKKEQALLLRLKGLDKKREIMQNKLGYNNMTFREIINNIPDNYKEKFQELFNTIQYRLKSYKEISKTAQSALEDSLYNINLKLSNFNNKQNTYNKDRNIVSNKNSFTSRRI